MKFNQKKVHSSSLREKKDQMRMYEVNNIKYSDSCEKYCGIVAGNSSWLQTKCGPVV